MSTITVDLPPNSINNYVADIIVSATQSAMQTTLALVRGKWQDEALIKLKSMRGQYLDGLDSVYPYGGNPFSGAVILRGKLPNMFEAGFPAFDIKAGFARSGRRRQKANGGWYMHIPMRHGAPNSYKNGPPMPKDIYASAKKLGNRQSLKIEGGQRTSWTGYQHKSNIYDGLTRIIKQYPKKTDSQYFTFRMVSDTSDPKSWMHPGYKGVKIAESLERYAYEEFKYNLERNLSRGGDCH